MFFLLEEQPSSVSFPGWDKYPLCLQEMNVYFLYFGKFIEYKKKEKEGWLSPCRHVLGIPQTKHCVIRAAVVFPWHFSFQKKIYVIYKKFNVSS